MRCWFGLDGGGTRLRLLYKGEDGHTSSLVGLSSNPYGVGGEAAKEHIAALANEMLAKEHSRYDDVQAVVLGSAGMGRKQEQKEFSLFLQHLFPEAVVHVTTDAEIFLVGALSCPSGFALIAGTGSIAIGRNFQGNVIRTGGYGWRIGDPGSGYGLADDAIRAALQSSEGLLPSTRLTKAVKEFFNLKELPDIITLKNDEKTTKGSIALFGPVVLGYAEDGDEVARDIVKKAADDLARFVEATMYRLPPPWNPELVLGGGMLSHEGFFPALVKESIRQRCPGLRVINKARGSAEEGALALALTLSPHTRD